MRRGSVVAVIALGGGLGAVARYAVTLALPFRTPGFPWGTLLVNAVGSLLIGSLMVLVTDVWSGHRLLRPFLGVGLLGGFTTFSTFAVEATELLRSGAVLVALAYLAVTPVAAVAAVLSGGAATRWSLAAAGGRRRDGGCRGSGERP